MEEKLGIRNHEGYRDPTAYEAIRAADGSQFPFMPIIYLCSPYSGDIPGNIEKAKRYARFVIDQGRIPICPHLMFDGVIREPEERDLVLFVDRALMTRTVELWVFGSRASDGMRAEIRQAKMKGMTIRFFDEDCRETGRDIDVHA